MSHGDITTSPDDQPIIPADFDDTALDDWIDGGEIAKHAITMHGKPNLAAEFEQVDAELKRAIARAGDDAGELAGGEVGKLRRRLDAIYTEWDKSRSVWIVRAITDQTVDDADDATVEAMGAEPTPPKEPAKGSPQSKHDEYASKLAKHEKKLEAWQNRQKAELIMRLVERIELGDGRVTRITSADQVLRMKERYGEHQIMRILQIGHAGRMLSPELKAPFSSASSPDDQT